MNKWIALTLWACGGVAFGKDISDCDTLEQATAQAWCRAGYGNTSKCTTQDRKTPYTEYCKAWATRRTDVCEELEVGWERALCELLALREKSDDKSSELQALKESDSDGKFGVAFVLALAKGEERRCDPITKPHMGDICANAVIGLQVAREGVPREVEVQLETEDGPVYQVQLEGPPPPVADPNDLTRVYELESDAIKASTTLAEWIEAEPGTEARSELMKMQIDLEELRGQVEGALRESRLIGGRLGKLKEDEDAVKAMGAVRKIARIAESFDDAYVPFREALARHLHRDRLDALRQPSKGDERALAAKVGPRVEQVTDDDIEEIENWVGGSWSTMNQVLFGAESPREREARALVVEAGTEDQRWKMDIEGRVAGLSAALERVPKRSGTSYRVMRPKDAGVFGGKILVGDLIMSKGFFATSMVKGADGAGGGEDGWGKAEGRAYLEIVGVSGADLGPYQSGLSAEREVLFGRDTVFQVEAIEPGENGVVFVLVKEVVGGVPEGTRVKDPYDGKVIVVGS